jgi:hypothetical protein
MWVLELVESISSEVDERTCRAPVACGCLCAEELFDERNQLSCGTYLVQPVRIDRLISYVDGRVIDRAKSQRKVVELRVEDFSVALRRSRRFSVV